MIVYEGLKNDFMFCVESDSIATTIEGAIKNKMGRNTPVSEIRSWENSLEYMYKVLNDSEIPDDAGIAIEYNIPQTSKRIDFLISGYDENSNAGVIIVELKQWDELFKVDGVDALVETYLGGGLRRVVHPSYQAWSYAQLIRDYNATVQDDEISLNPCVCMHNYVRVINDPVDDEIYADYYNEAPVYTKGQLDGLRKFIKKTVVKGDNKETLYRIENGKIRPSKSLQNSISEMLKGNEEFIMIDWSSVKI